MASRSILIVVCVVGILLINLYLGVRAGRGRIRTTADHVVGGRSLGMLLVFFVSAGEMYSSVSFLGQPGWAYQHGVGMLLPVGTLVPLMAIWLGPKIWSVGKEEGVITQAQLFGARFKSEVIRGMAAVIALVGLIPYLAVQIMGGGYIMNLTTQGQVPFWLGGLLAFGTVAIYVYLGGLRAISWVAVFKGILMVFVGVFSVLRITNTFYGGINPMFARLASTSPAYLTLPGPEHMVTYTFWSTSILVSIMAFYMWPHLFANFFSAESPRVIRKQAIMLPLYNLIPTMFLLAGFAGILVIPGIKPDTVMLKMVMLVAPLWLIGLFCAGALSASMVTGAACLLAAAATLGNDLFQPRLQLSDVRLRKLIQALVLLIVTAAYVVALLNPATIVSMILFAYGFTVQLFPIALVTLYKWRVNSTSAIAALAVGFALVALLLIGHPSFRYGVHPGLVGLAANAITMIVVNKLTGRNQACVQ